MTGPSSAIENGGRLASFSRRISRRDDLDLAGLELRVDGVVAAPFDGAEHRRRPSPCAASWPRRRAARARAPPPGSRRSDRGCRGTAARRGRGRGGPSRAARRPGRRRRPAGRHRCEYGEALRVRAFQCSVFGLRSAAVCGLQSAVCGLRARDLHAERRANPCGGVARAIRCCVPARRSFTVTSPTARSSSPWTTATRDADRRRVLELLAKLVGIRIDEDPEAARRAVPRRAPAIRAIVSALHCTSRTSAATVSSVGREHAALPHHDEDALEAQREPARGNRLAEEHADQVVVPPAAAETARQVRHGNLHDGAGVIRQPARKARIDTQPSGGGRRHRQRDDASQVGDGCGRRLVGRCRRPRADPAWPRCGERDPEGSPLTRRRLRPRRTARATCHTRRPRARAPRTPRAHRRRPPCPACRVPTRASPCRSAGTPATSSSPARSCR